MTNETKLLIALHAIEPLLAAASKAYQFGANSYAYEALLATMKAHDLARKALDEHVNDPANQGVTQNGKG